MLPLENNEAGETGARELIGKGRIAHRQRTGASGADASPRAVPGAHARPDPDGGQPSRSRSPMPRSACRSSACDTEETLQHRARRQAAHRIRNRAVLASEAAACDLRSDHPVRDVHDRADNATTFAIVARDRRMSLNSFGRLLRVTTWGESHGPAIGAVVDGCPPGLDALAKTTSSRGSTSAGRASRFTTQRREPDQVRILSGTFEGRTTGTPISLMIDNRRPALEGLFGRGRSLPAGPCRLHL